MALAQGTNVEEGECLLALEELHGGDLACGLVRVMVTSVAQTFNVPLMILQKMHEAAMLVGGMMYCFDALLPLARTLSLVCLLAAMCCIGVARPQPRAGSQLGLLDVGWLA